jgi:protein SCO1/2
MKINRKAGFYTIFFIALFLLFYLVLTKIIPGYGEVKMPILAYVQPFSFLNQNGQAISDRDVEGKVYVAEYFFTTCKGICPIMNNNLKQVYEKYHTEADFRILSHTVDPGTDSVGRMKHYADSLGVNSKTWWFLTGRKDSLYHAARVSYLLDDPKNDNIDLSEQFIHTQFFALVDRDGQVRRIYDGLKNEEMKALIEDIPELLKAKAHHLHNSNTLTNYPN